MTMRQLTRSMRRWASATAGGFLLVAAVPAAAQMPVAWYGQPMPLVPQGQPMPGAPQGQPMYAAPQGQPMYVAPQGQPTYVAPQGQPMYVAPQGQPMYVAPQGQPMPGWGQPEPGMGGQGGSVIFGQPSPTMQFIDQGQPDCKPPVTCPGGPYSCWEVISKSICGRYDSACYTPLTCSNFCETWQQPFVAPGAGSSGALRGGWVGAPNGFISREIDPSFTFTRGIHGGPNQYVGNVDTFTPLSSRLELGIFVPFIDSDQAPHGGANHTSFGDVTIAPRVMLYETKDIGIAGGAQVRVPTGNSSTGNDRIDVDPFLAVWADLGAKWQFRGGIDVDVPLDRDLPGTSTRLPDSTLGVNLSIGKTIDLCKGNCLTDVTPYVAANYSQDFSSGSGSDHSSQVSITPGVRFTLTPKSWLIVGVDMPVTGPRPFGESYTVVYSIGY